MGTSGIGASLSRTQEAISHWKPEAVISIGIAFGVDEDKQEIGEVLVSKQIQLYELQKVKENGVVVPRGDKVTSSERLLSRLKIVDRNQRLANNNWPKVAFGLILSGEKLVDSFDYRASLKSQSPEAIGGEMEAAGVYVGSQSKQTDWIIVKAICDWGHGKGNPDKEKWQKQAAENAATVVKTALEAGNHPRKKLPRIVLCLAIIGLLSYFALKKSDLLMSSPVDIAMVENVKALDVGVIFKQSALNRFVKSPDGHFRFRVSSSEDGTEKAIWKQFTPPECEISFAAAVDEYVAKMRLKNPAMSVNKGDLIYEILFWGQLGTIEGESEDSSSPFKFSVTPKE